MITSTTISSINVKPRVRRRVGVAAHEAGAVEFMGDIIDSFCRLAGGGC
jgi:hypothetical protein